MKAKLLSGLVVFLLVFTVACAGESAEQSVADCITFGQYALSGNATPAVIIVFYTDDGDVVFWCDTNAQIIDNGDTWDVISYQGTARGVNKSRVSYEYYEYAPIEQGQHPTDMADLGLVPWSPPTPSPPLPDYEMTDLRLKVSELENKVGELEDRIAELEAQE